MKNLNIAWKIGLLLFVLVLGNGALTFKLISSMSVVNEQSTIIAQNWLPSVRLLGNLNTITSDFRIAQLQHVGTTDAATMQDAEERLSALENAIADTKTTYIGLISSAEEQRIWDAFSKLWIEYMNEHRTFLKLSRENKNEEAAAMLYGAMFTHFNDASAALLGAIDVNDLGAQAASTEGDRIFAAEQKVGFAGLAATLLASFVIAYIIRQSVARPIETLKDYLGVLEAGDYSQEVPLRGRKDEIGLMSENIFSFQNSLIQARTVDEEQRREMTEKLERQEKVVELVEAFDLTATGAVSAVAAAATELSAAAKAISDVSVQTNEQVKSVVAASIQNSGTVQTVAASVEQLSAASRDIAVQVSKSTEVVQEANRATEVAKGISSEMLASTSSIGAVASTIDGIANQINLLALNATIEAVRAGEPGKGFSVVANEIKSLAGQTTAATESIAQQLGLVQRMAEKVAEALENLGGAVETVGVVTLSIAASVEQQTVATTEISQNMNTAALSVEQINMNISVIQDSTHGNLAASEQILSASNGLAVEAESLDGEVSLFLERIKAA